MYMVPARDVNDTPMQNFCKYAESVVGRDSKFVEVGSYIGTNGLLINRYFNEVHCVDAWIGGYDVGDGASQQDMTEIEEKFDANIMGTNIVKHKGDSLLIADEFPDNSLDVIYIDATHTYEGVKRDIQAWLPKLKHSGIIAGHDYEPGWDNGGVLRAIHECIGLPSNTFATNWSKLRSEIA